MHHLFVTRDDERLTLVMGRDEARILINFGHESSTFTLLEGEQLAVISRKGLTVRDRQLELPTNDICCFTLHLGRYGGPSGGSAAANRLT